MARCFDVDVEVITPAEAGDAAGRSCAPTTWSARCWLPRDGRTNPIDTTLRRWPGARGRAARRSSRRRAVTAIRVENGAGRRAWRPAPATMTCEVVVNCAGMWARELGRMAGVTVPLHACRALLHRHRAHGRRDAGSAGAARPRRLHLRARGSRRSPDRRLRAAWRSPGAWRGSRPISPSRSFPRTGTTSRSSWSRAIHRIPALETAPVRRSRQRPGELHARRPLSPGRGAGAAATSSWRPASTPIGIASAGGRRPRAGGMDRRTASRRWISGTSTSARVASFQANPRYLRDRDRCEMVRAALRDALAVSAAGDARAGVRTSALHDRLARRGACFGAAMGWERANWFATAGMEPGYRVQPTGGRTGSRARRAEHRAVREAVGLFDQSSFAKLRLEGPDALAVLQRLCANDVDVPPGRLVYTQMLNARGGIEADLTVTRLVRRRLPHRHRRGGGDARRATGSAVTSATRGRCSPTSPRGRPFSASWARARASSWPALTDADLSQRRVSVPDVARDLARLGARARLRVTYVGELGWELYVPTELAAASTTPSSRPARISGCVTPAITRWTRCASRRPIAAGVTTSAATTRRSRPGSASRCASTSARRSPAATPCWPGRGSRWLAGSLCSSSTIRSRSSITTSRSGATARLVGRIASGAYGHTVGRAVGLGWIGCPDGVTEAFVASGRWEIEIACERVPARAQLTPPYDPKSLRVRA